MHTAPLASEFARRLGARAFTFANHIVIGESAYEPITDSGFRLLAHELAHTIQQQQQEGTPCGVGDPDAAWEMEAELAAEQIICGTSPSLTHDHRRGQFEWSEPG